MKGDSIFFSFWTRCSRHSRLARGGTSSCVPNQKGWFMIFTGKWNLGLWFEILRSLEENNHRPPPPLLPCTTIGTSSSQRHYNPTYPPSPNIHSRPGNKDYQLLPRPCSFSPFLSLPQLSSTPPSIHPTIQLSLLLGLHFLPGVPIFFNFLLQHRLHFIAYYLPSVLTLLLPLSCFLVQHTLLWIWLY